MQPATTLTIASVGAVIAGSGTSETRMSRVPWMVVARMAPSSQDSGLAHDTPDGVVALSHM